MLNFCFQLIILVFLLESHRYNPSRQPKTYFFYHTSKIDFVIISTILSVQDSPILIDISESIINSHL